MNGRDSPARWVYSETMKTIAALLALLLLAAAATPIDVGPLLRCSDQDAESCAPAEPDALGLENGETVLARTVNVAPEVLPLGRPLMVSLSALASAELRWNGVLVGRNGVPGPDRASERPGRYFAAFEIPPAMVRPGENLLMLRLSAHRLWLPVHYPVHQLDVGLYETPALPGRGRYLPALLMAGAFAAAFVWFVAAALADSKARGAALLAAIAGSALLQLGAEASKSFFAYAYPWHLARISAIAVAAAATAVLIAAYAAGRFAPEWRRPIVLGTAAAAAAAVALIPLFDGKAMAAILAGAVALGVSALRGLRRGVPGAGSALAAAFAIPALIVWQDSDFLDRGYFILLAILLVALLAEQVGQLRAARVQAGRAAMLEERLRRAKVAGEPIVQLKNGAGFHRVAAADILCARAADDYAEVRMRDGRELLVTVNLSRLHERLLPSFARVHRSWLVNRDRIQRSESRPGGRRMLRLEDGTAVPVGRRYAAAAADATDITGPAVPTSSG